MIKKSIDPKLELGYAFTIDMNNKSEGEFNRQSFNKSAVLKIKYCNPQDIVLQIIPNKEVKKAKNEWVENKISS